ncbi:hypothetical protein ACFSTE_04620 [Aquimarina hainanensis]|uniref:Uncharacterized protein n=1 Tax=Aquimarina hainanensis TaxID=1578017 RepID=A0ABW5N3J9_9FLAO
MKKITLISFIGLIFLVLLYWGVSVFFTSITFSSQMEVSGDPSVYEKIQYENCSRKNQQSKDLKIRFSYKYPLVRFKGKLEVIDRNDTINNPEGKLLFSGKYNNKITIKNLCYSVDDEASLYKGLEFRFSDKETVCWFYADTGGKGYPFLQYDEVEIKIDWFSIHPSKPYQMTPIE